MDNSVVREPKQKRSIDKKNKIIKAGFDLFCEKGYYNTNTAEIAKRADVSTGTVYSYFEDKKSIFLDVIEYYAKITIEPMFELFSGIQFPLDLHEVLVKIIDASVNIHQVSESAHEEMLAMSHSDDDVRKLMLDFEEKYVLKFSETLRNAGINSDNLNEKIHIIFNTIEFYCHEASYHRHSFINYEVMKEEVIQMIMGMISNT